MGNKCLVIKTGLTNYGEAWQWQREIWQARTEGAIEDVLILTEHPPTYTIGRAGGDGHLLADEEELRRKGVAVFRSDRGGDITYHGPGQLVGYPILDLSVLYRDVHRYLRDLEEVIIMTVAEFGLEAIRVSGLTGVWVGNRKLASIGVKVSRWVTMHGFALNVSTDMDFFTNIVPCGIFGKEMVSMAELLGNGLSVSSVADVLAKKFGLLFQRDMEEVAPDLLRGSAI